MRKKIAFASFCSIMIILAVAISLIPQGDNYPTLASSSTFATISANYQRKAFYAESYHWLFYCNGSEIFYTSSRDGVEWNPPTLVRHGISSSGLSVWYDGKVHYAYASGAPGAPVTYSRGKIVGDKIEWEADQIAVQGVMGSTLSLTNSKLNSNDWALGNATNENNDSTTSIVVGTLPTGTYLLFEPGKEATSSIDNTSLPIECTKKGWRTTDKFDTLIPEGTWKITINLLNQEQTPYTGILYFRLWKSSHEDLSQAVPLTEWIGSSEVAFTRQSSEIQKTMQTYLPTTSFNNEYLFIELGWKVVNPGASSSSILKLECGQTSQVSSVTYEYYNGYCVTDSNGTPWISYLTNDGFYWNSYVLKANSSNASTWSLPVALSAPSITPARTCILPLNAGKLYALYASTSGLYGRLWNSTAWQAQENITAAGLVEDYGFSAISDGDKVHAALLENETNNILHFNRSPTGQWDSEVIQVNQDPGSFPILSIDKSTDTLYCFWVHNNELYLKQNSNGIWNDSTSFPFISSSNLLRGISCFYQVYNGKIGIAWIEEADNLFSVKYTSLQVPEPTPKAVDTDGNTPRIFMYASQGCGKCEEQIELLKHLYGNNSVTFYDITNQKNQDFYIKITSSLVDNGLFSAYDSNRGLIPLVGCFQGNNLEAITLGPLSEQDWDKIAKLNTANESVQCFIGSVNTNKTISNQTSKESLSGLFTQTTNPITVSTQDNFGTLVPLVSLAAAVDAVNPCELNAFLILLVYVFYQIGRKDVLKVGLSFSCAVFISYYLMGIGALRVLQSIPFMRLAVIAFGVTFGTMEILAFFGLERKHVPDSFSTRIRESMKRAINPYTAFVAGILVSLFLLPCTSGSYFVALDLLAKNATFGGGLLLLTLYNAIVILPFLVMTTLIYTLTFRTKRLRIWLTTKERWLRLVTGLTMIIISLTLLL